MFSLPVNAWLDKVEKSLKLGQEWPKFRECPIGVILAKLKNRNKNNDL